MSSSPRHLLLALAAALLAAGIARANPGPDRFERTRQRIDALVGAQRRGAALPEKPANPFLFVPPANLVAGPSVPTPEVAGPILADDDRILAYCAARLRISGQVERGGVAHLLINSATYREGDLVPVRGVGDTVYYVKIERVRLHEVIFRYNQAVLAVPFRG